MENIKSRIREYILSEFLQGEDPDNLTDATPLVSGGILDSLATLRLVRFLEETFEIELGAEDVDATNMDSVASIAALVASKKSRT
jgi:acyl carrier protein